jgi:hypothetical protein
MARMVALVGRAGLLRGYRADSDQHGAINCSGIV